MLRLRKNASLYGYFLSSLVLLAQPWNHFELAKIRQRADEGGGPRPRLCRGLRAHSQDGVGILLRVIPTFLTI